MKNKLKTLLKFAIIFAVCFIVIYLVIFSGGWRLFESGDPILIEMGVALIASIFIFAINETVNNLIKEIKSLEKRIESLENKK